MKRLAMLVFGLLGSVGVAMAAVNLNTASVAELDQLKGVGPGKAKAIVEYRTKNGPFKSVDDLGKVKGFGPKTLESLRADLTVGAATAPKKVK
jgi:competence protein ComEA